MDRKTWRKPADEVDGQVWKAGLTETLGNRIKSMV